MKLLDEYSKSVLAYVFILFVTISSISWHIGDGGNTNLSVSTNTSGASTQVAYADFIATDGLQDIVVRIADPVSVNHARRVLAGEELFATVVQGVVLPGQVQYNGGWDFHLDPRTVFFTERSAFDCDASINDVAFFIDEVGTTFLPSGMWCPSTLVLVEEL